MPEAVRITIVFDPETKPKRRDAAAAAKSGNLAEAEGEEKAPMTFQTIARLDLAELFNRETVSNSNANNNNAQQQQTGPEGGGQ